MGDDPVISHGGFHPDHSEEVRYFRENRVYTVQIESNLACPQGCLYCYASSKDAPSKELPAEDVRAIIDSAARMEVRAIDWLGGDPLVRKDWHELMTYAIEKGLRNNIWTSGLPLMDNETARKAVDASRDGFISVHLDSLDENIYAKLHTGDARKKVAGILAGVDNLISMGKDPENMINCITFTKLVAGDARRTIEFFFNEKGMRTCLTQMCRVGLAEDRPDWVPTMLDIREACGSRDEMNYAGSDLSFATMDTNKFYCGGMICVTIDGNVTPCSVIRRGFGNIRDSPLEAIVDRHREELLFTHLRDRKNLPGPCSSCRNNAVCWGCRATAFSEGGDMNGPDPNCYLSQMEYRES